MVVRSWSELDFDNVCSNAKVFGFDLDNTLASSKQPMKPAMIERFCALLDHTVVALISGGGMAVSGGSRVAIKREPNSLQQGFDSLFYCLPFMHTERHY